MLDTLQLTLTPAGAGLGARCLAPLISSFQSKQLATYGTTAVPLLQSCLLELGEPWRGLLVRKERKPHGASRLVEGPIDRAQPVLLVDDTLATGESVFRAVEALAEEGLDVEGVVCLVRYGAGGVSRVEERGLRVEAVLDLEDDLMPCVPEGAEQGPLNQTKWVDWPAWGRRAPEGLAVEALARLAMETYLREGVMLTPPRRVRPVRDSRGGVFVSVRRRADILDRLARDGHWHFPEERAWSTPEGIVRASVQAAQKLEQAGHGLDALAACAVAVTTFGPLVRSELADLDNSKTGLVVRSLMRRRIMGGALPNMPGLRNTFQQFRHAHTKNAQLFEGEPYVIYRHTLEKDSDEGTAWQPTGVPGTRAPVVPRETLRALASRARSLVLGREPTTACPKTPGVDQVFVSLYVDGALKGCVGGEVKERPFDEVLRHLCAEVWRDERFGGTRRGRVAVGLSLLSGAYLTDVADVEFMSKPFRLGVQCLEVLQGERRALLLPSVPMTHDLDALEYTQALVTKAGITSGDLYWGRYECDSALATDEGAWALEHSLVPIDRAEPWAKKRARLLALATSFLSANHRARGDVVGTYRPFVDQEEAGLDPARLAFIAWQKARVGLKRQASQDLARVAADTSVPVVAFRVLAQLALSRATDATADDALRLLEAIDAHGRFDLGDDVHDAHLDFAPGQALLAIHAALGAGLVADPHGVVPRALDWCTRRYRLNHSTGAAPWLMQALVAFGRRAEALELAKELSTYQSRLDGAFLTGQQDDCPGCTSLPPMEGLAAVYAATKARWLKPVLTRGLEFVDFLTLQEKDVPLLPNPKRALGGVRQSHVSAQVRQDFVGHLVNLLLALPARP
jgi:orotate phosphoribosyltransferase/AMMECR1 domain-containing protein